MRFFAIALFLSLATLGFGVTVDAPDKEEQIDFQALRDWINTKRQVVIKERGGNLSLSGEVRTELQASNEKLDGIRQRGEGGAFPNVASKAYDIEVNLMLDYRTDRTWAAIKIEFDNNAGTISGTFNRLALERAYLAGRVVSTDTYTMDLEFGRRAFSLIFDSRIEFGSFMDGIVYKYDRAWERLGDFYFHGGPFLIDERVNHYGYVFEIGVLNMFSTGLYFKYSLIDWDTKHYKKRIDNLRFRFRNSQVVLGFKFLPKGINKVTTLYSALLVNSAAHRMRRTNGMTANLAWYAGFSMGELRKAGDWSLDANYQWVEPQAIPAFDSSGIGRGNAARTGFYSVNVDGSGGLTTRKTAVGPGNYRGFTIDFLYLVTNNLTIYQNWQQSFTLYPSIGPHLQFKQYEIELIYAF